MVDTAREQEVWKQYPDYDFIEVSNLGRVRTKDRYVPSKNGSKRLVKGRILKPWINNRGYMSVHFRANDKSVQLLIHRAVVTCFLPNPLRLPEVNHKDNNPKNNSVSNLEWCTSQYNHDYKKIFGTSPAQIQGRPIFAVDLKTGKVLRFETQREAARQLGVNVGSLNAVLKGRYKQTHGFWFCYADENAVEKTREKFGDDMANKLEELIGNNYN